MSVWQGVEIFPAEKGIDLFTAEFLSQHDVFKWFEEHFEFQISWYQLNRNWWGGTGYDNSGERRFMFRSLN